MELFKLLGTVAIDGVEGAKQDIDDVSKKADGFGETLKSGITKVAEWGAAIATAASAAATAIGGFALSSSNDMNKAFNSFAASTGLATEELEKYQKVMQEVYKDNYGDSYEDIANTMATIAQTTGDIEPDKMKELSENALLLRDTFGMEVNESMRAVNMMMDQFGITGTEAFNLIAQGAQKGLNKNGDLLDSINEYSVHYKQLGYSATDFMNSLSNGTDAGTFSVDKLGDAMKEFGIRVKDTSTTTSDAFNLLGYASKEAIKGMGAESAGVIGNLDELQAKFAEGGESARQATAEVLTALYNMDDKVQQNAIGVGLFGTMWEDLGADGIKALMNMNGEIDNSTDALTQMSEVKYDDLGTRIEGVKRRLETSIITPLGKKLSPIVEKLVKTVENKLPKIEKLAQKLGDVIVKAFDKFTPVLEWLIDDGLPILLEILSFCIEHFDTLAGVILTVVGVMKGLSIISTITTAVQGASGAFGVFNAVLSANPIGSVVTALGLLAGGIGMLVLSMEDEQTATEKKLEQHKLELKALEEENAAIAANRQAIDEKATSELAEIERVEDLWQELQTLCDETGKVSEADKNRANFILHELNNALGTEYTMTGNQIQNYKDLQTEISNTIDMKKAEILFVANEEKYTEAIKAKGDAEAELAEKLKEVYAQQKKCKELQEEYDRKVASGELYDMGAKELEEYIAMQQGEVEVYKTLREEYATLSEKVTAYYTDISRYEEAASLMAQKKYNEAYEMMEGYNSMYLKASDIAGKATADQMAILEQQVIDAGIKAEILEEQMENCAESEKAMYARMVEEAKAHLEDMKSEYYAAGGDVATNFADAIDDQIYSYYSKLEKAGIEAATTFTDGTIKGLDAGQSYLENKFKQNAKNTGKMFTEGIASGVEEGQASLNTSLGNLLNKGLSFVKGIAQIHSPSELFADEVGEYIPSGVGKGVEDNQEAAITPLRNMIGNMSAIKPDGVVNNYGTSNSSVVNQYNDTSMLASKMEQLVDTIKNIKIYLDTGAMVGELTPAIDTELGQIYAGKERGR